MKKKMLILVSLVTLLLVTACQPPCEECPPTEVTRVVIETVEVEITVPPSESETVVETPEPHDPRSVDRNHLPDDLLEDVFYSTRPDESNMRRLDPYMANELILRGSTEILNEIVADLDFQTISKTSTADNNEIRLINTKDTEPEVAKNLITEYEVSVGKNFLVASPWDVEGSPWDVEGSGGELLPIEIPEGEFPWNQWAFLEENGINLFKEENNTYIRTTEYRGEDIRVFIYDTSPLPAQERDSDEDFPGNIEISIPDNNKVLLDVPSTDERYANTNEHGLFVASLVHYVAPDAEIHLIKVLNNQGVGDLYTLMSELEELWNENNGDLKNVVINLSLGFNSVPIDEQTKFDLSEDPIVNEFKKLLDKLKGGGAIIVAAAGNHSSVFNSKNSYPGASSSDSNIIYEKEIKPEWVSTIPARWKNVISVSGYGGDSYSLSCFSNEIPNIPGGDKEREMYWSFRAPSGGGYQQHPIFELGKPIIEVCQRPFDACKDDLQSGYSCPYTIVGTTSKGYSYWLGTSFGTPIVSGIMALVSEKCNNTNNTVDQKIICLVLRRYYDQDGERFNVANILSEGCRNPDDDGT